MIQTILALALLLAMGASAFTTQPTTSAKSPTITPTVSEGDPMPPCGARVCGL